MVLYGNEEKGNPPLPHRASILLQVLRYPKIFEVSGRVFLFVDIFSRSNVFLFCVPICVSLVFHNISMRAMLFKL